MHTNRLMRHVVLVAVAHVLMAIVAHAMADPSDYPPRLRGGESYRRVLQAQPETPVAKASDKAYFFAQKVDHNNATRGTFKQRFFYDLSDFTNATALLKIGGEGPVSSSPTGFTQELGKKFYAALFTLEHRWYGDSLPGLLTDTALMKQTLSVEQAMNDIKAFVAHAEQNVLKKKVKWVCVGGSYAGALCAWTVQHFPGLMTAGYDSSGPIFPTFNFLEFDAAVSETVSQLCAQALRNAYAVFTAAFRLENEKTRRWIGSPSYFSFEDMLWMLADGAAMAVQYGHQEELCDAMIQPQGDELSRLLSVLRTLWGKSFVSSCYYSTTCLSDSTFSNQWPHTRPWVLQCCLELAYWQPGFPGSVRSSDLKSSYFVEQCRRAFGAHIMPQTFALNSTLNPKLNEKIPMVMTQGTNDPWRKAGILPDVKTEFPRFYCEGCSHHEDLSMQNTSPAVKATQKKVYDALLLMLLAADVADNSSMNGEKGPKIQEGI